MKTVRQLIEELQKIDGDLEVIVFGQGGSEGYPCVPKIETFEISKDGEVCMILDGECLEPEPDLKYFAKT